MKNLLMIAGVALAFFIGSTWSQGQPQVMNNSVPQTVSSNRFYLYSATTQVIGRSGTVNEVKSVFKIDTWTGKTWTFNGVNMQLDLGEYWSEVSSAEEALELRKQIRGK